MPSAARSVVGQLPARRLGQKPAIPDSDGARDQEPREHLPLSLAPSLAAWVQHTDRLIRHAISQLQHSSGGNVRKEIFQPFRFLAWRLSG